MVFLRIEIAPTIEKTQQLKKFTEIWVSKLQFVKVEYYIFNSQIC